MADSSQDSAVKRAQKITAEECTAYFHGEDIGSNPMGTEYDPEEWLTKLRGGTSETELLKFDPSAAVSSIRGAMTA